LGRREFFYSKAPLWKIKKTHSLKNLPFKKENKGGFKPQLFLNPPISQKLVLKKVNQLYRSLGKNWWILPSHFSLETPKFLPKTIKNFPNWEGFILVFLVETFYAY